MAGKENQQANPPRTRRRSRDQELRRELARRSLEFYVALQQHTGTDVCDLKMQEQYSLGSVECESRTVRSWSCRFHTIFICKQHFIHLTGMCPYHPNEQLKWAYDCTPKP